MVWRGGIQTIVLAGQSWANIQTEVISDLKVFFKEIRRVIE
jgi:hypothetical protein